MVVNHRWWSLMTVIAVIRFPTALIMTIEIMTIEIMTTSLLLQQDIKKRKLWLFWLLELLLRKFIMFRWGLQHGALVTFSQEGSCVSLWNVPVPLLGTRFTEYAGQQFPGTPLSNDEGRVVSTHGQTAWRRSCHESSGYLARKRRQNLNVAKEKRDFYVPSTM